MMKRVMSLVSAAVLALSLSLPARAEMSDEEKAAIVALGILGVAALAHNKHHYANGYRPQNGVEVAEFERGYRDGLHGYPYWEHSRTRGYVQGYQAGEVERRNSMAHRAAATDAIAPHMANQGCVRIVAQNFAVGANHVHITRAKSPGKHVWLIETAVGHQFMTCRMRDTGEVIDLRGGRM